MQYEFSAWNDLIGFLYASILKRYPHFETRSFLPSSLNFLLKTPFFRRSFSLLCGRDIPFSNADFSPKQYGFFLLKIPFFRRSFFVFSLCKSYPLFETRIFPFLIGLLMNYSLVFNMPIFFVYFRLYHISALISFPFLIGILMIPQVHFSLGLCRLVSCAFFLARMPQIALCPFFNGICFFPEKSFFFIKGILRARLDKNELFWNCKILNLAYKKKGWEK